MKLRTLNARFFPKKLWYSPDWIVLGVNNLCNLHCKMCDVGADYNQSNFYQNLMGAKPRDMPIELLNDLIDQTAADFPGAKLGYAFTEPLIYPHLFESLERARDKKLYTAITTNALNLRRHADGLLAAEVGDLFVSLDGPPDIHNFIRGHKSSFQKALEGMEYLLDQPNAPGISVFCCITEWNIGHLEAFVRLFEHLPLRQLGFMHTNFTPQEVADRHNAIWGNLYPATASNMTQINLGAMDFDLLWAEMEAIRGRRWPFPVTWSPDLATREQLEVFYHHPGLFIGKRCMDAFTKVMVKSNGDVIPAHGRCYNLPFGNLHERPLKAIWNSDIASRFRVDLHRAGGLLPACSRCCSAFGQ
jgi:MoaA/NifB/PqqE/SkfB family radical SAM enzyme